MHGACVYGRLGMDPPDGRFPGVLLDEATPGDVKKAFFERSKLAHPDKGTVPPTRGAPTSCEVQWKSVRQVRSR